VVGEVTDGDLAPGPPETTNKKEHRKKRLILGDLGNQNRRDRASQKSSKRGGEEGESNAGS